MHIMQYNNEWCTKKPIAVYLIHKFEQAISKKKNVWLIIK